MKDFNVFHLNDINLKIEQSECILSSSPGVGSVHKNRIITGLEALPLLSKAPINTSVNYWHRIEKTTPHLTSDCSYTSADFVYAQIKMMWSGISKDKAIVVGYPSEYSEKQLGVLCGIFDALRVNVIGLVNSDLSSLNKIDIHQPIHLVRIQMNHTAQIIIESKKTLSIKSVKCKENYGLVQLYNEIAKILQKVFIKQCRVDPLINGDAEHYLRTQIPNWLKVANMRNNFYIETLINDNNYKAEVTSDCIYDVIDHFFKNLLQHEELINCKLTFCPTATLLAKRLTKINGSMPLPHPKIEETFRGFEPNTKKDLIVNLRDNFPKNYKEDKFAEKKLASFNPTHIIKENKGYKIAKAPMVFKKGSLTISIYKKNEKTYLQPHNSFIFVNEKLQNSEVQIEVGDIIKFPTESTYYKAIKVESD